MVLAVKKRRRKRKSRYHTGVHSSPKAGDCKYRSGWELSYMQHMDADPLVLSYLYEGVKIPYVSNRKTGKLRGYLPDFLVTRVDGTRIMIEVKPSRKVAHATVKKKLEAAALWCGVHGVVLQVITERELKGLGLL